LVSHDLPTFAYSAFAKTLGTAKQKKDAEMLRRMNERAVHFADIYRHFTMNEWIFDVKNTETISKSLVDDEQKTFGFFISELDWERYLRFFCYGIQKFVLKEEVRPPTDLLKTCIVTEPKKEPNGTFLSKMFPDISWAYKSYRVDQGIDSLHTLRTPQETKAMILKSKAVQQAIKATAKAEGVSIITVEQRAVAILERMGHTLDLKILRMLAWFFRKVWRRMYQGIHVDEKGLETVERRE
jgi:hypothetical protein